MKKTRKLCAIVIDTIGRELTVNRPTVDDEDGWPKFDKGISVNANDKVHSLSPVDLCSCPSNMMGQL